MAITSLVKWCRRGAGPAAALVALALAACSSTPGARQIFLPSPPKQTEQMSAAAQREHLRVLAAYGGAYEDAKLQAKLATVVERLVAASCANRASVVGNGALMLR